MCVVLNKCIGIFLVKVVEYEHHLFFPLFIQLKNEDMLSFDINDERTISQKLIVKIEEYKII